ncbi:protein kinase [Telmatobacter sp. DSM 110680]|uniref:non-specific serine/threonine protein kinase n=1 Tax=Telmatobacter sp. DSM 110680 TaxID=3036704 RepID=A0AAU7DH73_9BACT
MPVLKTSFSEGELIAGNYRVLSIAGSGGMGVVYRARDQRLDRTVALKFLPAELNASQREKERFLREARTASSLDHPNIGVIHGIEETADGLTFIVMAYYEGSSLAQRIQKGSMKLYEAIAIARQMAQGLGEAHRHGIVHRDVKPSNVMLTSSGLAKIVDFGLARAMTEQTASQTGVTGTVRYMSPEQAMDRPVDQRCDIWALGVVFAEMLTGSSPFHAESITSMLFSILNDPPKNLDSVHPALQPVLYHALAKDPERRYGSCAEFLADLTAAEKQIPAAEADADLTKKLPSTGRGNRTNAHTKRLIAEASRGAWGPAATASSPVTNWLLAALVVLLAVGLSLGFITPLREKIVALVTGAHTEKHVAVLPFDNIGSNPENAALTDGLMDSLAGRLSNLDVGNQSLWVVPNSEVRRRNINDPGDALKQLGANLVIKGSVQRDGSDIRLTVNLIDTKNLRQVGSAMVEDPTGDLSSLEDEAVSRLAKLMNISVTADMLRNTGGSLNPAAYEDYLTALGYTQRYDKPGNLDLAIASLQKAIQTDPAFALGFAQMAEAYRLKYIVEQNTHWLDEAQAYCQKATELDNRVPAVYVTLAQIHDALGKHDLALQEFQHALKLDPKDAEAMGGLARSYEQSGRTADAEKTWQESLALRPDDWNGYNTLGAFYDRQGKYPQAIEAYQHALQITPDNAEVYSNLGSAYVDQGGEKNMPLAEDALKKSIALSPGYPAYANLGMLYMQEKRYDEAATATEHALKINGNDYMVWNNLMIAYDGAKQPEKAAAVRHKAEELAEKVVQLKPRDALAQSTLASLYAADKMNDKAMARIRTSLALAPDDPNVLSNVGEAYEFLGDRTQALQFIEKSLAKGYALEDIRNTPGLQSLVADPRFKPAGK